jgi:hypothetical protein
MLPDDQEKSHYLHVYYMIYLHIFFFLRKYVFYITIAYIAHFCLTLILKRLLYKTDYVYISRFCFKHRCYHTSSIFVASVACYHCHDTQLSTNCI